MHAKERIEVSQHSTCQQAREQVAPFLDRERAGAHRVPQQLVEPDQRIGGGIAAAGDIIIDPIRRTLCERTSSLFHEQLRVVPAALGNDAGIIGSAALALTESPSPAPLL